jgi:uncharacterized protein (DUF58 family)
MTTSAATTVARRENTLRRLELLVTRKLDGLLQGDHQGLVLGNGTEAGDARAYQPGDDARRIDWNLTARANAPHVRETIADRELETWLVVDGTPSLDFGTANWEKRDLALAAAAGFSLLTIGGGNRVGGVLFDGTTTEVVPPRSGRSAALALLHRLDRRPRRDGGAGSLATAVRRARALAARRGVIVVVSDLLDGSDWARELGAAAARHDVIVVEVCDPREDAVPPVGLLTLVDPETGRLREVDTDDPRLRRRFAHAAAARRAEVRRTVLATGASHLVLSTDGDWVLDLARFTSARRRVR